MDEHELYSVLQVNMFLDRTSGEPIGFTVLGLMVIDKNALITVCYKNLNNSQHVRYHFHLTFLHVCNCSCS
jgi:hypothetical protein